jgi:hypothetical protein
MDARLSNPLEEKTSLNFESANKLFKSFKTVVGFNDLHLQVSFTSYCI